MGADYKKYTELNVWVEARKLVSIIYAVTKSFPKEEQFGLSNQMGRCTVSVPSNIAEGCGRNHKKIAYNSFLYHEAHYMNLKRNYTLVLI
jgi:four helix bundle protein